MKVLVLGGSGMAGHMIRDYLLAATDHDVWCTVRNHPPAEAGTVHLDARDVRAVRQVMADIEPAVVINAIGLLNENAEAHLMDAIQVNSLLPHQLAQFGQELGFRLIHISTDCVFSGSRGGYRESDVKDGTGVYAQTKSLGEVVDGQHLTIRTSIIGPECREGGTGLFEWFRRQTGHVRGYANVFWNGVTTLELAKTMCGILDAPITGLVHLTGRVGISKLDLLHLTQAVFERDDIVIESDDQIHSDKTLVNTRPDFAVQVPDYDDMLTDLKTWLNQQVRDRSTSLRSRPYTRTAPPDSA